MRVLCFVFAGFVALTAGVASADDTPQVGTVEDVAKLADDTTSVHVRSVPADVMKALFARFPDLLTLHIDHPGNRLDEQGFRTLARFRKLETLSIVGDPFLYDAEFGLLGRLASLRSLRLELP